MYLETIMPYDLNFLKKLAKTNNWTVKRHKNSVRVEFVTDISFQDDDTTCYVVITVNSDYKNRPIVIWKYIDKKDGHFIQPYFDDKRISWNYPKNIDLDGSLSIEDVTKKLKEFWQKKIDARALKLKNREVNKKLQNIENETFINKMSELAENHNMFFKADKVKLNTWKFNKCDIDFCKTKNCWRVRACNLNFSFFACKNLDEVYNVCKWIAEMPSQPRPKF
mgnify:CR=1 FL=1